MDAESNSVNSVETARGLPTDANGSVSESSPLIGRAFIPPAPRAEHSTQAGAPAGQRERIWTTLLFVTITSLPALLVGCTLGFPSIVLLDLKELEGRRDYQLSTLLSDVFGVS